MKYKTSETVRLRLKERRDAIKSVGGAAYAELLAKERAARSEFRRRHPEKIREREGLKKTRPGYHKKRLLISGRRRGRKLGMPATIRASDIEWPTHCPVLGIELDYTTLMGGRVVGNPANPSLDRFDNTKGYVPGNVFVVSFRANALKNNATADELEAVARYARHGCVALCGGSS
jgi:hypothetical protein